MAQQRPSAQEIVARGKRIYTEQLQKVAERDHPGNFLVIDVLSGDHEIAATDSEASLGMLARRPEAVLYGVRIGDQVAYRFGHSRTALHFVADGSARLEPLNAPQEQ